MQGTRDGGTSPTRNAAGGGGGGGGGQAIQILGNIHKRKNMDCLIVD